MSAPQCFRRRPRPEQCIELVPLGGTHLQSLDGSGRWCRECATLRRGARSPLVAGRRVILLPLIVSLPIDLEVILGDLVSYQSADAVHTLAVLVQRLVRGVYGDIDQPLQFLLGKADILRRHLLDELAI